MTLFYGARRAAELYRVELFEQLGARSCSTTEDGSRGAQGRVTAPLETRSPRSAGGDAARLYACGPTPMMRAVAQLAETHGRSRATSRSSRSWAAAWAAATAASC